jgi:flagellar motility protein MotE (MotC chaperone)
MTRFVVGILGVALAGWTLQGGLASGQEAVADAEDAAATVRRTMDEGRGLQRIAQDLAARERALQRRERSVGQRERDLRDLEVLVNARIEALEAARVALEASLEKAEALDNDRVTALVKMTEKMKEKQAAAVITELDDTLAVQVLDGMSRTKAGKALAAMDPKKAAKLAARLTRPLVNP